MITFRPVSPVLDRAISNSFHSVMYSYRVIKVNMNMNKGLGLKKIQSSQRSLTVLVTCRASTPNTHTTSSGSFRG